MASIGSLSEEITIRHIANEARQLLICCMGINDENVRMAAQMQFERFSLWASNIGVFAQGPASLDHRLRAAPTAKAAVEVELEGLCERLLTILNGGSDILEDKLDEFAELDSSEVEGFAKSLMGKANHLSDEQVHVLETVASVISALHRISLSIRKASNRNSLAKVLDLFDEDEAYDLFGEERIAAVRFQTTSAFQQYVEQVLRKRWLVSSLDEGPTGPTRFTEYRDILLGRCVEAIVTRRRQLMYLRSHQAKLQKKDVTATSIIQPTFQPRPISQRQPGFALQVPRRTANPLPILREETASQVDTAASELQTVSIPLWTPPKLAPSTTVSSEGGELRDMGSFELPPPPELKMGEREKACPYCCLVLPHETYNQKKGYKYWRRHLVEDMQPYICLFSHCNSGGKTYHTFAEWQMHLKRPHFGGWTCPLQHEDDTTVNGFTYETEAECENHLSFEHPELDNDQIQDALRMAGQQATLPKQCFVCFKEFPDTTDIVVVYRHIASHLQSIFVLALPWREDINLDNAVSSNGANSSTGRDFDDLKDFEQLFEIKDIKSGQPTSASTILSKELSADRLSELDTNQNSTSLMNSWMAGLRGQQPMKQPSTRKGRFLIPFTRNENFIGRELALQQLLQRIPPSTDNDDCQRTVLEGLVGIGKTQVATEVAYRVYDKYPDCSVFWVPAVNIASFDNAYREIGRELGLKGLEDEKTDVKSLVKAALDHDDSGSWLLIVDNADDLQLMFTGPALINYLPFNRKGSILFTTRNHEIAIRLHTSGYIITLKEMSNTATTKLLQLGLKESQISDTETTARLLEFLANHPLTVKQASNYMARTGFSTAEYLDYCQASDETTLVKLLSQDFEDLDHFIVVDVDTSIITILPILFKQISWYMPLALRYLRFICFLAERKIPMALFSPEMDSETDKCDTGEAIGTLRGYGFILEQETPGSFDIHRLVRLTVRNWVKEQKEQEEWITKTTQWLSRKFPFPRYENKEVWIEYLPHGQALLELRESSVDKAATASLLSKVAESLSMLGRYEDAEQMHQEALELRNKVLGKEHPSTIVSIYNLASALRNRGKYNQAEQRYRRTLKLRGEGKDKTSSIVDNMNSLAHVLRIQGKYAEAKDMYQRALKLGEQELGTKHRDTLASMAGLAIVFTSEENHQAAEKLLRRTLNLSETANKQSDTLDRMNGLAIVLSRQRKYKEAEETFRQTLELREVMLGLKHPHTLDSMNNLANVLYSQERYGDAEQMQLKTLELRMKVLGGDHPDTLISRRNLELILGRQGTPVDYRTRC